MADGQVDTMPDSEQEMTAPAKKKLKDEDAAPADETPLSNVTFASLVHPSFCDMPNEKRLIK